MGFACPVCDVPQVDAEHLAHHLAITATLHGGDHERWLEERVDDWRSTSPEELADSIVESAKAVDYQAAFARLEPDDRPVDPNAPARPADLDEATEAAIEAARRLVDDRDGTAEPK